MYCKNCGASVKEGASFCGNCGHPIAADSNGGKPTGTHPYHQLGGWLAFIAYGLLIGAILVAIGAILGGFTLMRYAQYVGPTVVLLGLVEIALYMPAVYLSFKMFKLIQQKDTTFLRFYELTMIVFGGIDMLLVVIGSASGYISPHEHIKSLLQTAVIFAIWLAYFSKSVRVRTYFGSDEYLKKSILLKNCQAPDPIVPDANHGGRFFEQIEEFTLSLPSTALITQKVREFPYSKMGVSVVENDSQQFFRFTGATFEAQLWRRSCAAEKHIYCFKFNQWKENLGGDTCDIYEMNMLLTSIKKMFLSIDPTVQVKTWKVK